MKQHLDVFFYEAFDREEAHLREFLPAHINAGYSKKSIQAIKHVEPPARIISVRTQSHIPENWITSGSLDAILTRSTGYDHVLAYAKQGVPCGYLPLYCAHAVAEQAMLHWMALLRNLPLQMHNFQRFHRDGMTGYETKGRTLVVFGVGNIGYEVYKIARGLEMQVYGVDINQTKHQDVSYLSADEGISRADIAVCAMNLTLDNRGYFNESFLRQSKKGIVFVNVSRGECSPSTVLYTLLSEGHLGGVGLDVYDQEKLLAAYLREKKKSSDPEVLATLELMKYGKKHGRVILTPHNAFNTHEGVIPKSEQSAQQIGYFLEHHTFIPAWTVPGPRI